VVEGISKIAPKEEGEVKWEREKDKKIRETLRETLRTNDALKGVFPWSLVIPASLAFVIFLLCETLAALLFSKTVSGPI